MLRYANVCGPRQDPHGEAGVVAIFARAMLGGGIPTIFGDGEQPRDFVYVSDVVRANVLALEREVPEPLNIGIGRPTSVNAICQGLARLAGCDRPPRYAPERPGGGAPHPSRLRAGPTRAGMGTAGSAGAGLGADRCPLPGGRLTSTCADSERIARRGKESRLAARKSYKTRIR
ncbi:MAG TPA: NAD-dependent epimerase/dehydratase family protein [Armatimonadota bacterium]|nr:NAD-dependent epimerase/dehydratase family protein [Armatimonadota bacterium]